MIKSFLKLVEIQTKLASMMPLLAGTLFALYLFGSLDAVSLLLLFISLLFFDMTTTAINNYLDYKRAIRKKGYNYEEYHSIVNERFSEKTVVGIIFGMLFLASVFGLILVLRTNVVVLLLGMFSFAVGILYSFGPVSISRTPFGEAFSGILMGFVIILLSVYIHNTAPIQLGINNAVLSVNVDIIWFIKTAFLSAPFVAGIANIMLANNICDMDEDVINKRYTLPVHIGRESALKLFAALYIGGFTAIVLGVILGMLPVIMLVALLAGIPVYKNVRTFFDRQIKGETFALSVKNFLLTSMVINLLLLIQIVIARFIS